MVFSSRGSPVRRKPRYPSPALVLSAHAARKKHRANSSAWAGTALLRQASSSSLLSSQLLEEPQHCGPITQKLLRNLKKERECLSCVSMEGRVGVPLGQVPPRVLSGRKQSPNLP